MRDLKRSFLLLGFLSALLATLAFSSADSTAASVGQSYLQQSPSIELAITIDPAIIEPGQLATVSITVRNLSPSPMAPEVQITLPDSVSTRMHELPSGTFFNAQSGTLSWQPVVPGNGSETLLTLPVVAQVADVQMPEQKISATISSGAGEIRQDVSFWVGMLPSASIKLDPPQVSVGQPIQLFGSVTGPGPVAQLWALGDGRIVEAENPTIVYPVPGSYEIVFQASTPMGVITQKSAINVVPQPIARFQISDNTPAAGSTVLFSNESGGQQPLSYLWDFGDGFISTDANPTHIYQAPGVYDVHLFLTGQNGQSEAVQSVTVGLLPVADFVIGDAADAGSRIQGQAFHDETVTSVRWDMGDGSEHEGQVIDHVYWSAGDYPVTVTVANEFGEVRMQRSVRVSPGPLFLYLPLAMKVTNGNPDSEPALPAPTEPVPQENAIVSEELPVLDLPQDLSLTDQLLAYINEARRLNGAGPLNLVPELSSAAQSHADDMAANGFTSHTGSDGSVPALRVQLSGYPGGYAGEATAWGMSDAIEPVRYWLTSPGHRVILLNPAATEVGVAFSENYNAPSVWYWTAEFASMDLPVIRVPLPSHITPPPEPVLTLLGPPTSGEFTLSADTNLIFTWSWPLPLDPGERFAVYLNSQGRRVQIGTVTEPQSGDQYQFTTSAGSVPALPGLQQWYVRLENTSTGAHSEQSESRPILFISEP